MPRERPLYQVPESDPSAALLPVQCTARAKSTGKRCSNRAILGGHVCRFHGGAAPQVQRAAAARLAQVRDLALESLARTLSDEPDFIDPGVRLKIITDTTKLIELLEGRATARTDDKAAAADRAVIDKLNSELDLLASRQAHVRETLADAEPPPLRAVPDE